LFISKLHLVERSSIGLGDSAQKRGYCAMLLCFLLLAIMQLLCNWVSVCSMNILLCLEF